jgi:hypothetical protein
MSSLKQIRANQNNGRRSNGPTTPEGRAASSQNALKHGLCSRSVPLPEEDREYLETTRQLGAAFYDDSRPVDSISKLSRYEATVYSAGLRTTVSTPKKEFCESR